MKAEQRAKRQEYKSSDPIAGIFRITHLATGKVLIGSALNLHGPLNRIEFELQLGCYKNAALQHDFARYGREAFTFEVVEEVKPSAESGFDANAELEKLEEKHLATLDWANTYNESDDIRFLRRRRRAPAQ